MPDLHQWRASAADLLLGSSCHGCGTPAWALCPRCRQDLAGRSPRATRPDPSPPGFPLTVTSSPYDELLQNLITHHKERQAWALTALLGDRLALSLQGLLGLLEPLASAGPVLVVPVPSATASVRARGLDSTWALTRHAARRLGGPAGLQPARLLRQRRGVADQAGLTAVERAANLAGAFVLQSRRAPRVRSGSGSTLLRPVILVDDVVTTGASLAEAARVLGGAGIPVLGAATVAATRRRPRLR